MLTRQYITIALAAILLGMSGGVCLYSHFCEGEDMNMVSLVKVEHQCATEEDKSCHASENTCDDNSDCCTSDVEHEVLDQVTIQVDGFKALLVTEKVTFIPIPEKVEQGKQSIAFYTRPPPPLGREITLKLERILC